MTGVKLQLLECRRHVLAFPLVLPTKTAFFPHVGPSFAAPGLAGPALETVPSAVRVGLSRCRFVQQSAQVDKMLLGG
jgi:hypothetical protein